MSTQCQQYKPVKTLEEQIEHLKKKKRVVFNNMNEEISKEQLLRYNYINIVTPFKYQFLETDAKKQPIKVNGNHLYNSDVDFNEYYKLFKKERDDYPIIIQNILEFEIHFKSIVSHYILTAYKLENSQELENFLDKLKLKFSILNGKYDKKRINHMNNHIDCLKENIFKYADVYCFFDRMSLGDILTVYTCLDDTIQNKIFETMKKFNMNFNVDNINNFINKIFCLVSIRNCVMHGNSLEILIRFYDPKKHEMRTVTDRKKYINMINKLKKEKTYELNS